MLKIDFDLPTYLRVGHGLAVVSSRLDHLLPEHEAPLEGVQPGENVPPEKLEKVVINRVFNPLRLAHSQEKQQHPPPAPGPAPTPSSSKIEEPAVQTNQHDDLPVEPEHDSALQEGATELSFRGERSEPVSGILHGSGHAAYRFNKGNSRSFFLRIGKSIIWGIELKSALKQAEAQKGDRIEVEYLGKTPIKVLSKIKKGTNTEEVWETRHRNRWAIRVLHD